MKKLLNWFLSFFKRKPSQLETDLKSVVTITKKDIVELVKKEYLPKTYYGTHSWHRKQRRLYKNA